MTNYVKKLIRDGVEYEVVGSGDTLPKEGTTGQVLTKTDDSYEWEDIEVLPEGGTAGQILVKSSSGSEWKDVGLVMGSMMSYAIVGGGGSGANYFSGKTPGGGGGGGGTDVGITNVVKGTYDICIGSGGAAPSSCAGSSSNGGNSYIKLGSSCIAFACGGKGGSSSSGGAGGSGYGQGWTSGDTYSGCGAGGGGSNSGGNVCRGGFGCPCFKPINYTGTKYCSVGWGGEGAYYYSTNAGSTCYPGKTCSCPGSGGGGGLKFASSDLWGTKGQNGIAMIYVQGGNVTVTGGGVDCGGGLYVFKTNGTLTIS